MKALLARMVKDRTILFVIAPILAIAAIVAASMMGGSPTQERAADEKAAASTTTTTAAPAAVGDAAGAVDGAVEDSTTYSGAGSDARQEALGYDDAGVDTPVAVLDETIVADPDVPATTVPGAVTTVPGATTTVPGATTTTLPTTTTTTPGPPPVVSESPAVALLPITGLLVAGVGVGLLGRRRSRRRA